MIVGTKFVFLGQSAKISNITVDLVLIAWFNNCVLVKSGQIANPINAIVDPVPYCSITHDILSYRLDNCIIVYHYKIH